MKNKIVITLLFSFILINAVVSQEKENTVSPQRESFVEEFDKNKIYYKETGQKIPYSEFFKIVENNPQIFLERETDDEGNIIRQLYDPNNQSGDGAKKILDSYISGDVPLPNFSVTTIDGEKIELKDLKGKFVIILLESQGKALKFNKRIIEELDKKINALNSKENVEAIVIYRASEDEVRENVELTNSNFKQVADGHKIALKYYIYQTPTVLLIDQNGKLIGTYRNTYKIKLDDHLSK